MIRTTKAKKSRKEGRQPLLDWSTVLAFAVSSLTLTSSAGYEFGEASRLELGRQIRLMPACSECPECLEKISWAGCRKPTSDDLYFKTSKEVPDTRVSLDDPKQAPTGGVEKDIYDLLQRHRASIAIVSAPDKRQGIRSDSPMEPNVSEEPNGSGFLVNQCYAVTNRHVVNNNRLTFRDGEFTYVSDDDIDPINKRVILAFDIRNGEYGFVTSGTVIGRGLTGVGGGEDYAVIRLDKAAPKWIRPLPGKAMSLDALQAAPMAVVGIPGDLVRKRNGEKPTIYAYLGCNGVYNDDVSAVQTDCLSAGGMSGGPSMIFYREPRTGEFAMAVVGFTTAGLTGARKPIASRGDLDYSDDVGFTKIVSYEYLGGKIDRIVEEDLETHPCRD